MITLEREKFAVDGITFGIPKGCVGLVDEDNECYGIVCVRNDTIDQQTAEQLLREPLCGEYEYKDVISAVKIFAAFDMDCEEVDFRDDDVFQDFGGELYAEMAQVENYIGLAEEKADENYAYEVHPQIRYRSENVLSYYWLDCHDDKEYYNYLLVCRMSNISTKSGTYAIYGEFLLPQENWKQELRYLLSQVTCNRKSVMDPRELK